MDDFLYKWIAIEGNIGAGKTTLAKSLAQSLQAEIILEEFAENPFLPKFYKQPDKHAFALEMSFLAARFQQMNKVNAAPNLFNPYIVSDYVFFKSLIFASVTLSEDEVTLYKSLFNIIQPNLPQPDVLIFLFSPIDKLLDNIAMRGRTYEMNIQGDYLEKIQQTYFDFFKQIQEYPIVIINAEKNNFVTSDHIQSILKTKLVNGINHID